MQLYDWLLQCLAVWSQIDSGWFIIGMGYCLSPWAPCTNVSKANHWEAEWMNQPKYYCWRCCCGDCVSNMATTSSLATPKQKNSHKNVQLTHKLRSRCLEEYWFGTVSYCDCKGKHILLVEQTLLSNDRMPVHSVFISLTFPVFASSISRVFVP